MSIDRTEAPAATGSFLRFAWGDQTGRGLTLPPTLGPPRLSVWGCRRPLHRGVWPFPRAPQAAQDQWSACRPGS